jgi:hypothetical protein
MAKSESTSEKMLARIDNLFMLLAANLSCKARKYKKSKYPYKVLCE